MNYTVTSNDSDGLTGIVLRLKLCTKGPGNRAEDWAPCLAVARKIADANGISDFNAIDVGQVLVIPSSLLPVIQMDPIEITGDPGSGSNGWLLMAGAAALGIGLLLLLGNDRKKQPALSGPGKRSRGWTRRAGQRA